MSSAPAGAIASPGRPSSGTGPSRLNRGALWHAQTGADGYALARHLLSPTRTHPVLVITTPTEGAAPLLDAVDLQQRVSEIADVVVLLNGPASWALAEGVPPRTEVYGGAGRVYPVDRGWWSDPFRAPLRFCWPSDNPARVADTLEDDAYRAAAIDGLLAKTVGSSGARPATGELIGFPERHTALLRLSDGAQAFMVVDQLMPGIEVDRLLQRGMRLKGRVVTEGVFGRFLPDPVDDDPAARLDQAYGPGDLVLARITDVTSHTATGLLHPNVRSPSPARRTSPICAT